MVPSDSMSSTWTGWPHPRWRSIQATPIPDASNATMAQAIAKEKRRGFRRLRWVGMG
jgi:hypothetical protein